MNGAKSSANQFAELSPPVVDCPLPDDRLIITALHQDIASRVAITQVVKRK
jgi:hypothetical protein